MAKTGSKNARHKKNRPPYKGTPRGRVATRYRAYPTSEQFVLIKRFGGYGKSSIIGANAAGTFVAEVVLTFAFVFVILPVTRRASNATVAGLVIGLALMLVHLIGIPIDGTSVNPARSLGPALFVGGSALSQLWVFLVAPLGVSALVYHLLYSKGEEEASVAPAPEEQAR